MGSRRSYSDAQLVNEVAAAKSWRGTLRELDLAATSSGAIKSVRSRIEELGIDTSHFIRQRDWDEFGLRSVVTASSTWPEVADRLGLSSGCAVAA